MLRKQERKESLANILVMTARMVEPDRSNFSAVVHYGAMAAEVKERWFALLLERCLERLEALPVSD